MDKLSLALMREIVRMKLAKEPRLRIQLLQQKMDKILRQASDKQASSRNI